MDNAEMTPEEQVVYDRLASFAEGKPFSLNPDEKVVRGVIKGLLKREATTGMATCPCRLAPKDPEKAREIVCPCILHEEEIREQGACHCHLFVALPD